MPITPGNNPAGRLLSVLLLTVGGDQGTRMLEVWGKVFNIHPLSDVEVARGLIALWECVEEVTRLIHSNPEIRHERYLGWTPSVQNAISTSHLQATRAQIITPNITPETLTRLEFCDEELRRFYSEEAISKENLDEIIGIVNDLFAMVDEKVIDGTLRVVLLEGIEKVRIAISLYQIHGAKGLKSGLQTLLGIVFTEQDAVKKEKETNADVISRLGTLLDKLDSFTANALKIKKALTAPVRFLLDLATEKSEEKVGDESAADNQTATDDVLEA